jgi:hypothetical protein
MENNRWKNFYKKRYRTICLKNIYVGIIWLDAVSRLPKNVYTDIRLNN